MGNWADLALPDVGFAVERFARSMGDVQRIAEDLQVQDKRKQAVIDELLLITDTTTPAQLVSTVRAAFEELSS